MLRILESVEIVKLPDGRMAHFVDDDAYSFIYHKKLNLFFYGKTKSKVDADVYHKDILSAVSNSVKNGAGNWDKGRKIIRYSPYHGATAEVYYHGDDSAVKKYADIIRENYKWSPSGEYRNKQELGIMGRYWDEKNVIALWEPPDSVVALIKNGVFQDIIKLAGLDPRTLMVDIEHKVYPYSSLSNGLDSTSPMTDKERREMMARQHVDPQAKEKLAGADYRQTHLKKATRGFDFPAQATAALPALEEGTILLKDLIKPW